MVVTLEYNAVIERCKEIEQLVDETPKPQIHCKHSFESVDNAYYNLMEYNRWLQECKDEYRELNSSIGYPNRRLFPKSLRRIK